MQLKLQPALEDDAPTVHASPQLSVADLFTVGIGPSSSHTVGPMRAAATFAVLAALHGEPRSVRCELYGSLALTGKGHGTDMAVMMGLAGWLPEDINPEKVPEMLADIRGSGKLHLGGRKALAFREPDHLIFKMG